MKPVYTNLGEVVCQLTTVHVAYGNTDTNEGRGVRYILGAFTTSHEAAKAGRGQGVMGSDGPIDSIAALVLKENGRMWCVPVGDVLPLYDAAKDMERIELREQALAKLTAAERRILGLE